MRNYKYSFLIPVVVSVALVGGIVLGNRLARNAGSSNALASKGNKIDAILDLIQGTYVDEVSADTLIEKTIPEMLKKLDPHSTYIPARELGGVEEEMRGNFGGIGVQFSIQNDTIMVVDVISGGPSSRLGILPGDRIVSVNDTMMVGKGIKNEQVLSKLRGEKGTHVKVGIKRKGFAGLMPFDITRGDIPIYSVDVSYMIDETTGYIKVSRFGERTYDEFMDGMAKLEKLGMEDVIVDLRGNPGGYLNAVIRMVNEFLEKGQMILYTQGNAQAKKTYHADNYGTFKNKGIVVLVDDFSASASEIFAGAIQDNDRGWIVGRRSFGKGLVQEQIPFSDGSAIRLTVARYYTPSGRCIQKPYDKGSDEYYNDIMERAVHGEFQKADSIRYADTVKYHTLAGRVVHGGGGIMPDFFVPADTSGYSPYYSKVTNLTYQFALEYADSHRPELLKFKTAGEFENYFRGQNILGSFMAFAEKKGIKPSTADLKVSSDIISTQLKAYIARNIIGEEGFYSIIKAIDKTLLEAIQKVKLPIQQNLANAVTK